MVAMNVEEKNKFNIYWKTSFKYLFIVFFVIVTSRLILLFMTERDDSVTLVSIALGYSIITFGSLFLALTLAFIAIQKERQ